VSGHTVTVTQGNLPTKASWNYDDVYLALAGGAMTGAIDMLRANSANSST
jgi:hypothetical protein